MKRVMVIGISAGVGKSTFAKRLGDALRIKVFHLDVLYWKPGWVEASLEEFSLAQQNIVDQESSWIIEGNNSNTYNIRAKSADTLIYLELPLHICLFRVVKRWITNLGKNRPDMGDGCTEKLDWDFIKFICTTYYPRKRKMEERIKSFGEGKEIVILKSKKEIENYLRGLEMKKSS